MPRKRWLIQRCSRAERMLRIAHVRWTNSVGIGGRFGSESVDEFCRNQWTDCVGIGGRIPSEYALSDRRQRPSTGGDLPGHQI
jgi:hypothetical protein